MNKKNAPARSYAEVKDLSGAPALFINGKPYFTMMMMAPWYDNEETPQGRKKLQAELEAGIELHCTCDTVYELRDIESRLPL